MREAAQELREHVQCEGDGKENRIGNVWIFKYLGSRFRADGDQLTDVKERITAATITAGKIRNI